MSTILSREERVMIATQHPWPPEGTTEARLCRAQARHLLAVLNEPCTKHTNVRANEDGVMTRYTIQHRKDCQKCMEAIEDEVNALPIYRSGRLYHRPGQGG